MKSKTIGILAGLTILGIVVAMFVNQEPASQLPNSGELLFPQLLSAVNDVNEVVVATKEQTVLPLAGIVEKIAATVRRESSPL